MLSYPFFHFQLLNKEALEDSQVCFLFFLGLGKLNILHKLVLMCMTPGQIKHNEQINITRIIYFENSHLT